MEQLPEELLCRIARNLPQEDRGTLCRVNKKFCSITTPILYADCQLASCNPTAQLQKIHRMLNTLVQNAGLRSHIREIDVGDWPTDNLNMYDAKIAPPSWVEFANIICCMPALGSFPSDIQQQLGDQLLIAFQDAMTTVVLSMLPNLKALTLNKDHSLWTSELGSPEYFYYHDFDDTLTIKLIQYSTTVELKQHELFKNLRYLFVDGKVGDREETHGWNICLMSFCLILPALKTFVGRGCQEPEESWTYSRWVCEERASTVTDITLSDCKIGTDYIRKIIRSCRALNSLKCLRLCSDCFEDEIPCDYSHANVRRDLDLHHESIHELHLHSQSCGHTEHLRDEPIESFAALKNLTNLVADENVLFGLQDPESSYLAAILPPSLQRLVILADKHYGQYQLLFAVVEFLMSREKPPIIEVRGGLVHDAEEVLSECPGTALQEIENRAPDSEFGTFVMYRCDDQERKAEAPCGSEAPNVQATQAVSTTPEIA